MLWNYLGRVTSLTHLSLPTLRLPEGFPPESLILSFPELQYLHIHVALAPHFADQPMKKMEISTDHPAMFGGKIKPAELMEKVRQVVRQHWQSIVFPHVEYLETGRFRTEMNLVPMEFWREFSSLLNVKQVR